MGRRLRRSEWVILLVLLVAVLTITFWPTPVDGPFDAGLQARLLSWHAHGVPGWFDYDFLQNASNVVLFAPLGALIASVALPRLWWASGVLGLALSLTVEFVQAEFLPARFASAGDLAANTAGALLGGAIVAVARALRARRRRASDASA